MEFRNFTREDWMSYPGAELFADGSTPAICDTQNEFTVIVDGMGVYVDIFVFEDGYENPVGVNSYNVIEKNVERCRTLGRSLTADQINAEKLLGMGFQHITEYIWGRL